MNDYVAHNSIMHGVALLERKYQWLTAQQNQ
jgi:hypothetical protein